MIRGRRFWAAWTAAILAVVALSYASARSIVMQAGAGAGTPALCSIRSDAPAAMSAAEKAWLAHAPGIPGKPKRPACPFCAAAAHVSPPTASPSLAPPTAVSWIARTPVAMAEPPWRLFIRARARAPPVFPQDS